MTAFPRHVYTPGSQIIHCCRLFEDLIMTQCRYSPSSWLRFPHHEDEAGVRFSAGRGLGWQLAANALAQ